MAESGRFTGDGASATSALRLCFARGPGARSVGPSSGEAGSARHASVQPAPRVAPRALILVGAACEVAATGLTTGSSGRRGLDLGGGNDFGRMGLHCGSAGIACRGGRFLDLKIWRKLRCSLLHSYRGREALSASAAGGSALTLSGSHFCGQLVVFASAAVVGGLAIDTIVSAIFALTGVADGKASSTNGHSDRFSGADSAVMLKISPHKESRECGHRQKECCGREGSHWMTPASRHAGRFGSRDRNPACAPY